MKFLLRGARARSICKTVFISAGLALSMAFTHANANQAVASSTQSIEEITEEGSDYVPPLTREEQEKLDRFSEISTGKIFSAELLEMQKALEKQNKVPADLLKKALVFYNENLANIDNKDYLTIVDFKKHSSESRFFVINMKTGDIQAIHVAHGSGSDPKNTGIARIFSNIEGSKASSLGFYRTAETYSGAHGYSLRLDGLSKTNSNVRERAIVVHGADYVHDGSDVQAGRSWGCFALSWQHRTHVIELLKEGSIIYAGVSN